ncbi:uncharacterized protein LOC116297662 [Actinia tenebrosa]|uniref:Uncharacterized protein LOC116297662 n=1 Tax=Actinia tenebrosa TaxID=6105 RepID=A0A6P8IAR0_ACTTE|nr:uncharacterized protein LOC116297662 [Actinia tenebrosa]
MHLMNVMVKGRVLNILLPLLSLLRVERTVASSQETSSNFTVSRTPGFVDSFTFKAPKSGNTNCSLINPDICAAYGGIKQETKCETKELCCEACRCVKDRPTFLVHKQRCVEDKDITEKYGLSKSDYRFNLDVPNSSCQSQSLATLNTTAPGRRNFSICTKSHKKILRCTMSTKESKYLHHNGRWIDFDSEKRRGFSIGVLQLKWQAITEPLLKGSVVMLDVTCYEEFFSHMGIQEITVNSRLLFKIAGSEIWQGSNVFQIIDIANPTNKSGGLVVMPTTITNTVSIATMVDSSTASYDKEKLNVIHVPGEVDMILVVVAAVLGTLLFIAIVFACIGVGFIVMRKKKKAPLGANNPLYERGPDMTLIENRGSHQTFPFNSHFYQPLVENTREVQGNPGEPIYQSLDEQVRVRRPILTGYEENPNRCSLADCDMTSDGYLIPTDGHTLPEPPTTPVSREDVTEDSYIDVLPEKSPTEDKSLNYKYDRPEEIISDHSPTISLRELPSDVESDQESNYDDVKVASKQREQTKEELENFTEGKDLDSEGKEHCKVCKGTIGNYGIGEDCKPVKCLCDVTTKL